MTTDKDVGIAFPANEDDRELVQGLVPHIKMGPPHPGSVQMPCLDCGMPLVVGPKLYAKRDALLICCPLCGVRRYFVSTLNGRTPEIISLATQKEH